MANCLKCAHAKEIARLRDICLNCVIGKAECGLSHGGVSFVSMDAAKSPEMVTRGRVAPEYSTRSEPICSSPRKARKSIVFGWGSGCAE